MKVKTNNFSLFCSRFFSEVSGRVAYFASSEDLDIYMKKETSRIGINKPCNKNQGHFKQYDRIFYRADFKH